MTKRRNVNLLQSSCTVLVVLVLLASAGWLVWQAMLRVPANAARVGLLVTLVLLPAAAWAGWCLGHVEATGRLAGIDQGVDKIMDNLTKAAMLKVSTAQAMHQVTPQAPPPAVLPNVEIIPRLLVGDVIDV